MGIPKLHDRNKFTGKTTKGEVEVYLNQPTATILEERKIECMSIGMAYLSLWSSAIRKNTYYLWVVLAAP